MDVFGKKLQRACTAKCFRAEFPKLRFGRSRKLSVFLKTVYFCNLCGMLIGMGFVTARQMNGYYHHSSITVDLGNFVWERAFIVIPPWLPSWLQTSPPGEVEQWTLVYSYFNGVYEMTDIQNGRPIYTERRKFDRTPFEQKVPAVIKYCNEGYWVFTHEDISRHSGTKEGCNWLLRSPYTTEFDLLNVESKWQVWVGVIGTSEVSIVTNECRDNADCNLNGDCVEGKCSCYAEDEVSF